MTRIYFADDLDHACPSRWAGQRMLDACADWGEKYGVKFSTDENPEKSKTKVIIASTVKMDVSEYAPLTLNGRKFPFFGKKSPILAT